MLRESRARYWNPTRIAVEATSGDLNALPEPGRLGSKVPFSFGGYGHRRGRWFDGRAGAQDVQDPPPGGKVRAMAGEQEHQGPETNEAAP